VRALALIPLTPCMAAAVSRQEPTLLA